MNNELERHKTNDKIKWILTLLAFILVGVMLAGIICGWFDKKEQTPKEPEQTVSEDKGANGGLVLNPSSNSLIRLAVTPLSANADEGIAAQAEDGYTLTATVQPANADDTAVDWSVAWSNASSSWASGKTVTDYVTVTPASDGALTARVECKQAFGEQVTITVTYRHDTSITATATADYREKLESASYTATVDGSAYNLSNGVVLPYSANASGQVNVQKSVGTVAGNFETSCTARFSDEFLSMVSAFNSTHELTGIYQNIDNRTLRSVVGSFSLTGLLASLYDIIHEQGNAYGEYYTKWGYQDLMSHIKNSYTGTIFTFEVIAKDTNSGKTVNYSYNVNLNRSQMIVYASSLSLGNKNIVF